MNAKPTSNGIAGSGEMAERICAFDWSITPLGPTEHWSPALKATVSMMLPNRFPLLLWWGPDYISIYNDAYIPVLGTKHPRALGQPVRECWQEIWPILMPLIDTPFHGGPSTWNEDIHLELNRHGFVEETHFTIAYSPIPDETVPGGIGGVLATVHEITAKIVQERRLASLRELGAHLINTTSAEDVCRSAAETLARHDRDVPFAEFYLDDRLVATTGARGDAQAAEPMLLAKDARLIAGISQRLAFDEYYKDYFELLRTQIASAIVRAREYEAEKQRVAALAEIDRAKTAFFSNVSHEFRTPLTLMLGPIEDLLARKPSDLAPDAKGQLEIAHRNSLRLLRLVNTLLDFSRIEAGRAQALYEPTDLAAYTADLASAFRSATERAGLRLVVDCPRLEQPVFVDREMWEKIVLNLVSNAFKFTFDGEIVVSLRADGSCAELRVRDTGVGIPAEALPHVFERFHRVPNMRSRTQEGSGIGLALVRELVQLHGGEVSAVSTLGQGTTLIVRIPFGTQHLPAGQFGHRDNAGAPLTRAAPFVEEALRWLPEEAESAAKESQPCGQAQALPVADTADRPRVLVADDNADLRQYLQRLLGAEYRVQVVPDGAAALDAARALQPDLVLCDVMMPKLDGIALLHALRADAALATTPVILLSARAGEEARIDGMRQGADDYLVKPFSAGELLARVASHLALARLRDQMSATLREREYRLNEAQRVAKIGSWEWDVATDHNITTVELNRIYGLPENQPIPDFKDQDGRLYPHEAWGRLNAAVQDALRTGQGYNLELPALRAGEPIWVETRSEVVRDATGKIVGLRGTVQDITERVHVAQDLIAHVRTEETLRAAKQSAERASESKSRFLAAASHDLRQPLQTILLLSQVLAASGLNEEQQRIVRQLSRSSAALGDMLGQLLEISRLDSGNIRAAPEAIRGDDVLGTLDEEFSSLAAAKGVRLDMFLSRCCPPLFADPKLLLNLLRNLLGNALKFTERGRILLAIRRHGERALVQVWDTGIGIAAEQIDAIFEEYVQIGNDARDRDKGAGLGLSIVRRLAAILDTEVTCRSRPGRGSVFEFTVPLATSAKDAAVPPQQGDEAAEVGLKGQRVVVVEDNREVAYAMTLAFQLHGALPSQFSTAEEALASAEALTADCFVTDYRLPGIDGVEFLDVIRHRAAGPVRAVLLTGEVAPDQLARAKAAGWPILTKPVRFADVLSALKHV